MPSVLFSYKAAFRAITTYTREKWGEEQAIRYIDELEHHCHRLGQIQGMGRECNKLRPGLRRTEAGEHVIFYQINNGQVLIVQILHKRMLPGRHSFI